MRTNVKLGRSSVNQIEIIEGLQPGDQVILSDMSAQDAFDRIRLISRIALSPASAGSWTELEAELKLTKRSHDEHVCATR